jgi:hypothetical protein
MELQTQKTMRKLSGVNELEFYLKHPDEYIRHQAILRLGQLRNREALAPLNKIMEDPLEIPINRDIAAWVLKSTGLIGNDNYYIGNHYLDRFTGTEKLKDFYYPCFMEGRTTPEYHFGSSGIEALLLEETLLIRAESLEEKVELPFSLSRWLNTWVKMKLKELQKGSEEIGKKSAAVLSGLMQRILHPEKQAEIKQHKRRKENAEDNKAAAVKTKFDAAASNTFQTDRQESPEIKSIEPVTENSTSSDENRAGLSTGNPSSQENIIPIESRDIHQTGGENKPGYYMKPFTLKACPQDKGIRKSPVRSKIYVRGNTRELSFADAIKGISLKILKIILLPFVILWNQKVVFLTLLVCLYLFFSFVPFGRMLFYRRSPELARMNDKAVKTAQTWISDQIAHLQEMASEYELVRDIQKRMVTETQEKPVADQVKYIVVVKNLNLRKEPGTHAEKLLLLEQNMIVEYLNQSVNNEKGETWLYIKAPDGTSGWSYANYLKKLEVGIEAYEGK